MAYAKKVYNFDLGRVIDRTLEYAGKKRKKFDIDFKDKYALNPQARNWTYGASADTIEKAIESEQKIKELSPTLETRIVESATGKILSPAEIRKKLSKVI